MQVVPPLRLRQGGLGVRPGGVGQLPLPLLLLAGPAGRGERVLRPPPLRHDAGHSERRDEGDQAGQRRQARASPRPADQPLGRAVRAAQDRLPRRPPLQVVGKGGGRAVAVGRLRTQALQADRLQVAIDLRVEPPRRGRFAGEPPGQSLQRRVVGEGRPAGEEFVEDGPEGVDVGGGGQGAVAAGLFGGHVPRRADDQAGARQRLAAEQALGDAEVRQVRSPARVEQDVRRLQVAVQQAVLVRVVDRPRDRRHEAGGAANVAGDRRPLGEAAPLDQLHAEERDAHAAQAPLADLVDRHDVRVVEAGGDLRLGAEAAQRHRVAEVGGPHDLQRDDAVETQLPGPVDDAHAAAGDLVEHLVTVGLRQAGRDVGGRRRGREPPRRGVAGRRRREVQRVDAGHGDSLREPLSLCGNGLGKL